ncbi:MAG: phosphoribosylglycinamide formyltransferase [Desulfosarcina sp.]|nr:phosphoribosylglycinamide formyltransferase [Desulfobacterales bacterium]
MTSTIRIGALISGGGTNLQAVIDACEAGKTGGQVVFVGSDNPEAKGLQRADRHGIPSFVVDYGAIIRRHRHERAAFELPPDFDLDEILVKSSLFPSGTDPATVNAFMETRAAAEAELLAAMTSYGCDLLILAGFMRNLTPYFIDRVNTDPANPRIMNIHPALLPAFPGTDGYGDTYRYGCKIGGCTVHFIDYGEDSGPIIGQGAFDILPEDSLDDIKARGLEEEWKVYPACIKLFAQGRLKIVEQAHTLPGGKVFQRKIVAIAS